MVHLFELFRMFKNYNKVLGGKYVQTALIYSLFRFCNVLLYLNICPSLNPFINLSCFEAIPNKLQAPVRFTLKHLSICIIIYLHRTILLPITLWDYLINVYLPYQTLSSRELFPFKTWILKRMNFNIVPFSLK